MARGVMSNRPAPILHSSKHWFLTCRRNTCYTYKYPQQQEHAGVRVFLLLSVCISACTVGDHLHKVSLSEGVVEGRQTLESIVALQVLRSTFNEITIYLRLLTPALGGSLPISLPRHLKQACHGSQSRSRNGCDERRSEPCGVQGERSRRKNQARIAKGVGVQR